MKKIPVLVSLSRFSILVAILVFCFSPSDLRAESKSPTDQGLAEQQRITWFEGSVQKWAYQSADEYAVVALPGKESPSNDVRTLSENMYPGAMPVSQNGVVTVFKLPVTMRRQAMQAHLGELTKSASGEHVSPVFYATSKSEERGRMVLTAEIIVRMTAKASLRQIIAMEKDFGLMRIEALPYAPKTFRYQTPDALSSLTIANQIHATGLAEYAYPNWIRPRTKRFTPNDTLFGDQWHLENSGQVGGTAGEDVNIALAWDSYLGSTNEVIAIVDDGVEIGHEDLAANILAGYSHDYTDGDGDPSPSIPDDNHGTACAGVAAAVGNNATGVSGAAPSAALIGFRLLGANTDANEADALSRSGNVVDIYSNSWGPPDDSRLEGPGPLARDALAYGIANGRSGLGSIYTWAGGNGFSVFGDDSNADGYANSRYTIAVAACTNTGGHAPYSEPGANILVAAPSSGGTLRITTTDRTGAEGYDDTSNYTALFGGTSSATPLVSGIIALMLEANPNLTWRDVQHILMSTAQKNDPTEADWTTNGAGYAINHKYGFGRIDALAATAAAQAWVAADPELSTTPMRSSPNISIPDNDFVGVSDAIHVAHGIAIESVQIYFTSSDHTYWSDLDIVLTSPSGTQSRLARTKATPVPAMRYDNWRFTSMRHFGEGSQGVWTLHVSDQAAGDTGTFDSWRIQFHGTGTIVNYTIDASAGAGGTITPAGTSTVEQGQDQQYIIFPNTGYAIGDVVVDGVSMGAQASYTFRRCTQSHTIAATFVLASSGGGGGGCFLQTAGRQGWRP